MNNQVKLKNLKVHRTNSQTILYHVRFSADTASQQQHFLSSFLWFLFVFLFFVCVCIFLNKKYIFWYTFDYVGEQVVKKNFSPGQFPQTRLLFWPNLSYALFCFSIRNLHQHQNCRTLPDDLFKIFTNILPLSTPAPQCGGVQPRDL